MFMADCYHAVSDIQEQSLLPPDGNPLDSKKRRLSALVSSFRKLTVADSPSAADAANEVIFKSTSDAYCCELSILCDVEVVNTHCIGTHSEHKLLESTEVSPDDHSTPQQGFTTSCLDERATTSLHRDGRLSRNEQRSGRPKTDQVTQRAGFPPGPSTPRGSRTIPSASWSP